MSTFNTSVHGVNPESLKVFVRRFDSFVACDISANSLDGGDVEVTLFFEEHYGTDLHDALVHLRSVFPNATVEDVR